MMDGWIKLHRELMDKAIWTTTSPEQKTILLTILMMANHTDKQWIWKGRKYTCKPGQFITSLDSIAKKAGSGISTKNVRTALKKFEKYGFLANQSSKTGRLITIVNWGTYQLDSDDIGKATGKEVAKHRQRGGKEVATNKNDKKERMRYDKTRTDEAGH